MRTTRLRALGTAAALLALVGTLAGCGNLTVQDVTVYRAGARAVAGHPGGSGVTSAGITISVSVDFADLVTDVGVRPGDQVRREQPLLSLDPGPFQSQAAQLTSKLQLNASQIQSATQRMNIAASHGDQAAATALAEQINAYQGQQAILQQQIDIAEQRTSQILSPIDGVIGNVNIQPGGRATPGQVLLTVLDLTHIQVTANIPTAELPWVQDGTAADVSFVDLPGIALQGRVVQVAAAANPTNGQTFHVTIDAPNTPDKRVIPNVQAYVRLTVNHQSPIVVARSAVVNIDEDPTVYVVEGQVVHRQHVEVGDSDGTYVAVLQGLRAGDFCVILANNQTLADGDAVRIVSTQT
jgi:membrane fusion protein (multidrug efflux system)